MKILLGLSGGLDSSYAAYYLKSLGHSVTGVCLKMHEFTDTDVAKRAADECGIEYTELDCTELFEKGVIQPFIKEYMSGRTPNPCVFCNPAVKFGAMYDYAVENGFDKIATGHYCGVGEENGRYFITRATYTKKDQSYVLWGLSQKQLSMLYLPLSDMSKDDIRTKAGIIGLSAKDATESQEICFIPNGDYASYIENRCGTLPQGDFISPEGEICGRHKGFLHYTVGQRKWLGIALGRPVFIRKMDSESNRIYLADSGDEFTSDFSVENPNLQKLENISSSLHCLVRQRYSAPLSECTVDYDGSIAEIHTEAPIRAVTPGQSAVFYDENGNILFGGYIK